MNYDKRTRDTKLETEGQYAINSLLTQSEYILNLNHYDNRKLILEIGTIKNKISKIETNLKRELHYITEHTIHHIAIIGLGKSYHYPTTEIDNSFGFAYSTMEYKKK